MNIIVNGGFESGKLSPGWIPSGKDLKGGVTNKTSYSGDYCLELDGIEYVEQVFWLKKGISDLSFQTKYDQNISARASFVIIEYADGTSETNINPFSTKWQEVSCPVDSSKCITKIKFSVWKSSSHYFDDIYLEGEECYSSYVKEIPDEVRDYINSIMGSPGFSPIMKQIPPSLLAHIQSQLEAWGYGYISSKSSKEEKKHILALEERLFYLEEQMASLLSKQRKTRKTSPRNKSQG